MGQRTHRRLDRLQIVSVGRLPDQSTTQFHRWRTPWDLNMELQIRQQPASQAQGLHGCGYISGTCIQRALDLYLLVTGFASTVDLVYASRVIDNCKQAGKTGESPRNGKVDTKITGFVFLLILPCGRFLSSGSPALHYAGTDRLQMVGVGSLHVDSPLVLSSLSIPSGCEVNVSLRSFFAKSSQDACERVLRIIRHTAWYTTVSIAGRRKKNKDHRTAQKARQVS